MKRGFTLIELLVVIAIIGLLSSVVLASLDTARSSARDTQRIQNLKQIQTALELYHADNDAYPPESFDGTVAPGSGLANALVPDYMPRIPADPRNSDPYIFYYDGRHICPDAAAAFGSNTIAILFAKEMENAGNANYTETVASCGGSIGGQGRSGGTQSYNIIVGPGPD